MKYLIDTKCKILERNFLKFPKYRHSYSNQTYFILHNLIFSCIIVINQKLIERLGKHEAHTNEWKEQIVDFWLSLPHFWDGEAKDEHVDNDIDFTVIHSNPDFSLDLYQPGNGEVYRSGGGDYDETISGFVENVDTGASFVLPSI